MPAPAHWADLRLIQSMKTLGSIQKIWTSQLSSLLGHVEVSVFENKLRSLNVTGLDEFRLSLDMFCGEQEEEVADIVRSVGEIFTLLTLNPLRIHMKYVR